METNGGSQHQVCGGLFGCGGDDDRRYMAGPDVVDAALTPKTRDRIDRMDELNQEALEPYVASYRVSRRRLVGAGGLVGFLASVAPAALLAACGGLQSRPMGATPGGRTHTVESTSVQPRRVRPPTATDLPRVTAMTRTDELVAFGEAARRPSRGVAAFPKASV